ncbi:SAR1012 family small protein [Staphylococcus caeli]|nr:SAR1012 family small protein [Staphylococcus caeli]
MKNIIKRVFRALAVGYIVKAIRNLISKKSQ